MAVKLVRSDSDRYLGGVCGGIAEYFKLPVKKLRIIWILSLIFGGAGLFVYLILWCTIPASPGLSRNNNHPGA